MTEFSRRNSDNNLLDINQMIAEENDPKQRAFLIVLNNINLSLMANTQTVQDISVKLESHIESFKVHAKDEEAMINKGKGAWKIMAWVLGVVQVVAIGMWTAISTDVDTLKQWHHSGELVHQQLSDRITSHEKTSK